MQSIDNSEPTDEADHPLTRRNATRAGATLLGLGGTGALGYQQATSSTLAITAASLALNSATADTNDGFVDDITIGDPTEGDGQGIVLNYEGLENDIQVIDIALEARLKTEFGGDSDGDSDYEPLMTGTYNITSSSGELELDYLDVFDFSTVSLFDHSGIGPDDFAADSDGTSVSRELFVRFTVQSTSLSASDEASNTITVNNLAANADVGGTIDTEITH